jgi:serine/threonine-protein kinase RsbW
MPHKIFPAELEHLYEMLEFIKEYVRSHHVSPLLVDQITLAAEEALVNIISYGYPEHGGKIDITCKDSTPKSGIKIVIKDQGIPFNPIENVPTTPPTASNILTKSETSLGGYGIYILVGLMDRVEYKRIEGGNMLSLIKYL